MHFLNSGHNNSDFNIGHMTNTIRSSPISGKNGVEVANRLSGSAQLVQHYVWVMGHSFELSDLNLDPSLLSKSF